MVIARALEAALTEAGHQSGIVTTPSNRFGRQGSAYLANWLTDVGVTGGGDRVDQIISLRFPSFAVRHERHVCWLNHTMREYYDLWERFTAPLSPEGRFKEGVRRTLIQTADSYFLKRNVTRLFAQSRTVQDRLTRFNGAASEVLYPPPPPRPYRCDEYGDYLFFASRMAPLKRADLVLRALAEPAAEQVRMVFGGEGEELPALRQLARDLGVEGRVVFTGRLDERDLIDHLARCRAVVFVPIGEDYGFVTVEAFASGKAVITTLDSGGPAELVRDGHNGLVTAPEPAALASALARMVEDRAGAEAMGARARDDVRAFTWDAVVRKLVMV